MDIVYILLRKYSGVGGKATDKLFNCTIKCYSIYEILRKEKILNAWSKSEFYQNPNDDNDDTQN